MKRYAVIMILAAALASPLLYALPVSAANATFGQKILPLDCVFQVVNVGTGTLYYLTPAACGVLAEPSPAGQGTSQTTTLLPAGAAATISNGQYANTGFPVIFSKNPPDKGSAANPLQPWQPVVSTAQSGSAANPSSTTKAGTRRTSVALATFSVIGLLVLAVFVF